MAEKNQPLRLPPQSVEAEQAVLGCMLIDPEAVPKVLHVLTEKSFYKTAHSHIYSVMGTLFEKNKTVDNITVTDELKKSKKQRHSPEPRAQSPGPRAQSPEPRAQSSEPRAQSPEPRAQSVA